MQKRSIPEQSPLDASPAMCSGCGTLLVPEAVMGPRGVETLRYKCENEETGCSYTFDRKVPISHMEMKGIKKTSLVGV